MKKTILSFLFLLGFAHIFCQSVKGEVYIFDKAGNPISNVKKAVFLQHIIQVNDTTFVARYYHFDGPMIKQESFKDSLLTTPHGRFCWYNNKGEIDSTGYVANGKKDGYWEYVINKHEIHSVTYDNGKRIKEQTLQVDDKGNRTTDNKKDNFEDSTQQDDRKKASFKGDINKWVKYCQENLQTPERLQNTLGFGIHSCMVVFLINKEGKTDDIYLSKSVEWSGDAEVMRLIADSPNWEPATINGKPVIFRQRQSLSFQVSRGR